LQADRDEARRRDEVLDALRRDLEAARYAADRAFRQYNAADPANRLVAAELELRWNRALEHVRELEARIERHVGHAPATAPATRDDYVTLASQVQRIWHDPASDVRLKKRIVRTLIHEVIADTDAAAGAIMLVIHWVGGIHTELRLRRRRRGQRNDGTAPEIIEAVRVLARICSDDLIAGVLNRNDLRTGPGNRWTRERVTALRSYHAIPVYRPETREGQGWMNLTQAAAFLGVSAKTLRKAAERGDIAALHPLGDGPWLFDRATLQGNAAQLLVRRAKRRKTDPAGLAEQLPNLFASMTKRGEAV
jgi:hypothetical protein